MAERPVFIPSIEGPSFVARHEIAFTWFPGLSLQQAQRSIASLHQAATAQLGVHPILEISSKSADRSGVELSAFNLMLKHRASGTSFSVECAFQSSKVFEHGGPYEDLLAHSSRDAKTDPRLKSSGALIGFRFFGEEWRLHPPTAFYDWLFMRAVHQHHNLAEYVLRQSAFSDIAFNPRRSLNCQAHAAALYVSLSKRGLLTDALLEDRNAYLELMTRGLGH